MMKRLYKVAKLMVCIAVITAYASASAIAQNNDDPTLGEVVYIDPSDPPGKLKVKQKKGEKWADATVGMPVRRGYTLILDYAAKASIVCGNKKKYDLTAGPQGSPCTAENKRVLYDGSSIPRPRGYNKSFGSFLVLLSPRMTALFTTRPTVRWSPAAAGNANVTYRVTLYDDDKEIIWRREVTSKTEIEYPTDAKELIRGEFYKVVVEAGRASSEQELPSGHDFRVITEKEAKIINDIEAEFRLMQLPEAETQFLMANLYAANGLASESIEKLIKVKDILKAPAVLRMLGDLYAVSGLQREAIREYKKALALPQIESDIEGQALTLTALGRSYLASDNGKEADIYFTQAVVAFGKLGDTVTVEQLRNGKQK